MTGAGSEPDAWLRRLRSGPVCVDTMIVRHLSAVGGGDHLAHVFDARLLLPEAVEAELRVQAYPDSGRNPLPGLRSFLAARRYRTVEFDEDADAEIADIRLDMWGRAEVRDSDTRHLGESQCLFVCERDGLPFISHDSKAMSRARSTGVAVFTVVDVLHLMVRLGIRRPGQAWDLYERAVTASGMYELPGHPVETSRDRFLRIAGDLRAMRIAEQVTDAPLMEP